MRRFIAWPANDIANWFDPKNIEHLRAFKHLEDTGFWPVKFLPKHTAFHTCWKTSLMTIIVDEYLKEKLGGGEE